MQYLISSNFFPSHQTCLRTATDAKLPIINFISVNSCHAFRWTDSCILLTNGVRKKLLHIPFSKKILFSIDVVVAFAFFSPSTRYVFNDKLHKVEHLHAWHGTDVIKSIYTIFCDKMLAKDIGTGWYGRKAYCSRLFDWMKMNAAVCMIKCTECVFVHNAFINRMEKMH